MDQVKKYTIDISSTKYFKVKISNNLVDINYIGKYKEDDYSLPSFNTDQIFINKNLIKHHQRILCIDTEYSASEGDALLCRMEGTLLTYYYIGDCVFRFDALSPIITFHSVNDDDECISHAWAEDSKGNIYIMNENMIILNESSLRRENSNGMAKLLEIINYQQPLKEIGSIFFPYLFSLNLPRPEVLDPTTNIMVQLLNYDNPEKSFDKMATYFTSSTHKNNMEMMYKGHFMKNNCGQVNDRFMNFCINILGRQKFIEIQMEHRKKYGVTFFPEYQVVRDREWCRQSDRIERDYKI